LARVAQFFTAVRHRFTVDEEVIGNGLDSQRTLIKASRIRSRFPPDAGDAKFVGKLDK